MKTMRSGLILIGILLLLSSCSIFDGRDDTIPVRLNEPFELGYANTAILEQDIRITLDSVSDGRCPSDVVCFWEGRFDVVLALETPSKRDTLLFRGFLGDTGDRSIDRAYSDYVISLSRLDPYPRTTRRNPMHVVTLRVQNAE